MKILIEAGHGNPPLTGMGSKQSPDGRIREYVYCREIVAEVVKRLKAQGYDAENTVPENGDISLGQRCARVNAVCDRVGAKNVLFVSIHNNAAGCGQWMTARGWEAWTSKGQTMGDKLAECLYDAAQRHLPAGTRIRTDMADGDRDKEANFAVLHGTRCAACLTENLFQDNRADVDYLLSAEGREAIVALHVDGIRAYVDRYGKK